MAILVALFLFLRASAGLHHLFKIKSAGLQFCVLQTYSKVLCEQRDLCPGLNLYRFVDVFMYIFKLRYCYCNLTLHIFFLFFSLLSFLFSFFFFLFLFSFSFSELFAFFQVSTEELYYRLVFLRATECTVIMTRDWENVNPNA